MHKFRFGFTMAEVMIAVVIVGIIAAATVPNLVRNYNKKAFDAKISKMHHDMEQNLELLRSESIYNDKLEKTIIKKGATENALKSFFDKYYIVKSNDFNNIKKTYSADNTYVNDDCKYGVILKDNSLICINSTLEESNAIAVYVDTNGYDGPNISGEDIYAFKICNDFSVDASCIDYGSREINIQKRANNRQNISNNGTIYSHFAKYLLNN